MPTAVFRVMIATACAVTLAAFEPCAAAGASEDAPEAESGGDPGRQAFVGRWTLNRDLSEDPQEKMQEAMQQRMQNGGGRGGGGGRGRGGGMGRGGGGGKGGGGRGSDAQGRRTPMMAFFSADELTVTHIHPAVAMVEPDGLVRTLQPDGEKYQVEPGEGEVKTRWQGDRLVVETKTERGKMKETWSVSPETGLLTVKLELQPGGSGMPKVVVDRAYDPIER